VEAQEACKLAVEDGDKQFRFGYTFNKGLAGVKPEFSTILVGNLLNGVDVLRKRGTDTQPARVGLGSGWSSGITFA
jgi:hypothetical protein